MSIITEFWFSTVNTFGALYAILFKMEYFRTGKAKLTPQAAKQCVAKFLESFPGIFSFTPLTLFDESKMELITFAIMWQE